MRNRSSIILFAILLLALSVRLLGIRFGLPHVLYADEAFIVNHAVAFGTGDLNPHDFIYPSLYPYVLFVVYGITYVGGRLVGAFASVDDFIRLFFSNATYFYLPGRVIAALSGVVTVWAIYRLGRRAYNLQAGMVAAALLSVAVLHVTYSHYVKTHVPAGLLVTAVLWFAWSVYEARGGWRPYVLAGAFAGLAASTVYHAGLSLIAVFVAHALAVRESGGGLRHHSRLLGAALASFLAFVLTTPFAVLDAPTFFRDMAATGAVYYGGGFWEHGTFYPFTSLLEGFGPPLGLITLLGLAYAIVRHRPADLILASQPLFLGLFLMLFRVKEPQHMLIAFPALCLLAAVLVVDAVQWVTRRRPALQSVAAGVATVLIIFTPARISFEVSHHLSLPDTRVLAKDWVREHISPGSKIVMDSGKYYLETYGPPLPMSRWTLERLINRGETSTSGVITKRTGTRRRAFAGEVAFFEYQLRARGNQPGYDVFQILHDPGLATPDVLTLSQYADQGVQYAIVNSRARDAYARGGAQDLTYPEKAAYYRDFYECLASRGTLVKEFTASDSVVGPTLMIYGIGQAAVQHCDRAA